MEGLWLIIAVTVGLLAVIAIALSTRKKRSHSKGLGDSYQKTQDLKNPVEK